MSFCAVVVFLDAPLLVLVGSSSSSCYAILSIGDLLLSLGGVSWYPGCVAASLDAPPVGPRETFLSSDYGDSPHVVRCDTSLSHDL